MSQLKINALPIYSDANVASLMRLNQSGWTIDRFGHATKTINGEKYRYKFLKTKVRKEVQIVHAATRLSEQSKEWVHLRSANYKKNS